MAFNPITGLVYIPTSTANTFTLAAQETFAITGQDGAGRPGTKCMKARTTLPSSLAPLEGARGAVVAWHPATQQMR
jgi:hypothetical protein